MDGAERLRHLASYSRALRLEEQLIATVSLPNRIAIMRSTRGFQPCGRRRRFVPTHLPRGVPHRRGCSSKRTHRRSARLSWAERWMAG